MTSTIFFDVCVYADGLRNGREAVGAQTRSQASLNVDDERRAFVRER